MVVCLGNDACKIMTGYSADPLQLQFDEAMPLQDRTKHCCKGRECWGAHLAIVASISWRAFSSVVRSGDAVAAGSSASSPSSCARIFAR